MSEESGEEYANQKEIGNRDADDFEEDKVDGDMKKYIGDAMNDYVSRYGFQMQLPAIYSTDAQFIPGRSDFCLFSNNYALPDGNRYEVDTYNERGEFMHSKTLSEAFSTPLYKYNSITLFKLVVDRVQPERSGMTRLFDVPLIGVKRSKIVFSDDGTMLALYIQMHDNKEDRRIRIYELPQGDESGELLQEFV